VHEVQRAVLLPQQSIDIHDRWSAGGGWPVAPSRKRTSVELSRRTEGSIA